MVSCGCILRLHHGCIGSTRTGLLLLFGPQLPATQQLSTGRGANGGKKKWQEENMREMAGKSHVWKLRPRGYAAVYLEEIPSCEFEQHTNFALLQTTEEI
jgi:hypothetical protein